jgi:acyl-coenzyme A synthetase/AMP-(fatty) acid ligase/thioesterase domain-containing protein
VKVLTLGLMADGRRSLAPLDVADVAGGVLARFRTVVEAGPDAVAVVDSEQSLTFAELAGRACAVAETLWGLDDPAEPVTVLCRHDAAAVATLLGVVLSGHPLLVMDPLVPVTRLRGFAERIGARTCLADAANLELAEQVARGNGGHAVRSPADTPRADGASSPVWDRPPDPAAIAVLGFTSGSTGRPKVVALDHRHLVGDAWAGSSANDCVRADDVMAHTLPLAFAAGMNVTLTGVLAGATMAMYDTRAGGIAGLAPWIERSGVTVLHASPGILRAFVGTAPTPAQLRGLRSLTLAGEAAHGRDVDAARRLLPPTCTVFHRLGSTETGLIAELRLGQGDPTPEGPLPVGDPIGITGVRLLDESGAPVPDGEPGIVEVTRSYLATCYWQNPAEAGAPSGVAADNQAFTDNGDGTRSFRSRDLGRRDDRGQLCLLGRRDHSVKIRGYMVEPGEVDAALFALPDVREAVTVGLPRKTDGALRLVSYLVPATQQLSPAAIRAALRETLPSYMVPQSIVLLSALPRTERGKIDRSALPAPVDTATGSAGQEFSAWERLVAQVWAKALFLDDIGLDDDFFELGGDSLAAEAPITNMISGLGVNGIEATTALLVQAPTIREVAARLPRKPERNDVLVPIHPVGSRRPLFVVAGGGGLGVAFLWLARHLGADQPVWGLQAHGMERRGVPDWSVEAIARRNVAAVRSVQPNGPYLLAGHSFGGLIALEMAHQLRRAGLEVGKLIIIDSYPPDPDELPPEPPLPILARVKKPLGLALTGIRRVPPSDLYWQFYRLSGLLQRRYHGVPWSGDTVVIVADESPDKHLRSRWSRFLTGKWRMVTVGGDHLSMIRDPYIAETAGAVSQALQEWRDPASITR